MKKILDMVRDFALVALVMIAVGGWWYANTPQDPSIMLESAVKIDVVIPDVPPSPHPPPPTQVQPQTQSLPAQPPEASKEEQKKSGGGYGSGTVIGYSHYHLADNDGIFHSIILTAAHVIEDMTDKSEVFAIWKGQKYRGHVLAKDADLDLALIEVAVRLPKAEMFFGIMVESESEWVVGYPFGLGVAISQGFVGTASRDGLRQGSASVWFGNSGGGTFIFRHDHYVLAGVTDAIYTKVSKGSRIFANTVEFFVTMDRVKKFLADNHVMD